MIRHGMWMPRKVVDDLAAIACTSHKVKGCWVRAEQDMIRASRNVYCIEPNPSAIRRVMNVAQRLRGEVTS